MFGTGNGKSIMNPKLLCSQDIETGEIRLTRRPLLIVFMVTLPTELLLHDISSVF